MITTWQETSPSAALKYITDQFSSCNFPPIFSYWLYHSLISPALQAPIIWHIQILKPLQSATLLLALHRRSTSPLSIISPSNSRKLVDSHLPGSQNRSKKRQPIPHSLFTKVFLWDPLRFCTFTGPWLHRLVSHICIEEEDTDIVCLIFRDSNYWSYEFDGSASMSPTSLWIFSRSVSMFSIEDVWIIGCEARLMMRSQVTCLSIHSYFQSY